MVDASGIRKYSNRTSRRAGRYIFRNQVATARGSNLTQVPILKLGMRPAFANLKIVMRDTASH
jgi:hypothetical protein